MSVEEKVLAQETSSDISSILPSGPSIDECAYPVEDLPRPAARPMRVLSVTNMYPTPKWPAFGTFVFNEVKSLREAGVSVDVLVMNGRDNKWSYLRGLFNLWRAL